MNQKSSRSLLKKLTKGHKKETKEASLGPSSVSQPSSSTMSNGQVNGAWGGHRDMETDSVPESPGRHEAEVEHNGEEVEPHPLQAYPCKKNPRHRDFKRVKALRQEDLPRPFNLEALWLNFIVLKAMETVKLTVNHTNGARPDSLGFRDYAGSNKPRFASGTAFLLDMKNFEQCNCSKIRGPHHISGVFLVMTAAHVVFDDEEARSTLVEFFYDSDDAADKSEVVKAMGVKLRHIDVDKNMAVIECRTHDMSLCHRLEKARKERDELTKELQSRVVRQTMVVLISHPHGLAKHVSFGNLKDVKEVGDVKRNSDGMDLIGCTLTYTTPTCPGAGGGSINVIGGGDVCLAFAPHCASKGGEENVSGLGWARYPVPWNSPVMGPSATAVEIRNMSHSAASSSSSSISVHSPSLPKNPVSVGSTESF